ncbi:MAG: 50S ribosomal protein L3 [Sedimentisphaerales bacterium]|nr:50S ribosomal protein L3 [Sedimentisphaerales bacterium]
MTRLYNEQGKIEPVTVVLAGPCTIMQIKTMDTDGYMALQLGYEDLKKSRCKKPQTGHAEKSGASVKRFVREVRLDEESQQQPGEEVTVEIFEGINYVDVTGTTKGKGYAGVMKRFGFKGMSASHGTERKHRHPGGIGSNSGSAGTGRGIRKGKKMAGHMGHANHTTRNHKIVAVDKENNLLMLRGAVAGPRNGYLVIRNSKTKV